MTRGIESGIAIPLRYFTLPKAAAEPIIEVADFLVHATGGQARAGISTRVSTRCRDFHSVFGGPPERSRFFHITKASGAAPRPVPNNLLQHKAALAEADSKGPELPMTSKSITVTRAEAIERLSADQLLRLTSEERAEELEVMMLENWSDAPGWNGLPPDVRSELNDDEHLAHDPSSSRYDPALLICLRSRFAGSTNAYLRSSLQKLDPSVDEVVGSEEQLFPCPCCGRRTLSEQGSYDICKVCWWEDDGQDNPKADKVLGGPNYGVSLTQGRVNYLIYGISDPSRDDLRALQDPPEKYATGRVFSLAPDHALVCEPATSWESRAFKK